MKRFLTLTILLVTTTWGYAQLPADATPRVPALDSFHEVIARIWHEAWPEKNTALLRQLAPEVEKGVAEVSTAKLPHILHEKQTAWDEGLKKLQSTSSEYMAAAKAKDDARLLNAAEALHAGFEQLMRTIRPVLRELDEFHSVLYMLYHHYLPQNQMEKIKVSAAELKQKMDALDAARLPDRLKQKEPEFQEARAKLSKSVGVLESAVRTNNEKTIKQAVEAVHTDYQSFEHIF